LLALIISSAAPTRAHYASLPRCRRWGVFAVTTLPQMGARPWAVIQPNGPVHNGNYPQIAIVPRKANAYACTAHPCAGAPTENVPFGR
jgi:hypothetical protein